MKTIFIRTTFEGVHSFPKAEGDYEYLKYPHRHKFFVEVEVIVNHNEREVEFLEFKRYIDNYCQRWSGPETKNSCETMAEHIALHIIDMKLKPYKVTVSEDSENGAIWYSDDNNS